MDRRERSGDPITSLMALLSGFQSTIYTAMPGVITSFNAGNRTVTIQPAIQAQVQNPDGSYTWVDLPLLLDCPVIFPSGGGVTLTFPVIYGDECLVIFASRCIDAWWQSGGHANLQADLRMHDLSDGFALVGVSSIPKVIPTISTTKAQLRTDDGLTYVEVDPAGKVNVVTASDTTISAGGKVTVSAAAETDITSPIINLVGTVNITGPINQSGGAVAVGGAMSVAGALSNAGKNVGATHVHSGVTSGLSNTGAPI